MAELTQATALVRILGDELRNRRKLKGLTLAQAAEGIRTTTASLSRWEAAKHRVPLDVLPKLLDQYGVEGSDYQELLKLGSLCYETGWWADYDFIGPYVPLEDASHKIVEWAPLLVPGLLQTRGYAEAVFSSRYTGVDRERRVEARMRRQQRLSIPLAESRSLVLIAIIDESVLYRTLGHPQVLREQLVHLREASDADNILIQILPFAADPHPGLDGPCVLMSFRGVGSSGLAHAPVAVSDTLGGLQIQEQEQSLIHAEAAKALRAEALHHDESRDVLERRIAQLPR